MLALQYSDKRCGESFRIGHREVRPLRKVQALQLRVIFKVDAGRAGALQQHVPGLRAREIAVLVIEIFTIRRGTQEDAANAARFQLRDRCRGANDLLLPSASRIPRSASHPAAGGGRKSRLKTKASVDAGPQVSDEYLFKVVDAIDEVAKETG